MLAVLAVTCSEIICICGDVRNNGNYSIITQTVENFPGIKKGKPVSSIGLQKAVIESVKKAELTAQKRIKSLYVGVPGAFCKVLLNNPMPVDATETEEEMPADKPEYMDGEYELIHRLQVPSNEAKLGRGTIASVMASKEYIKEVNAALKKIGKRPTSYTAQCLTEGLFVIPQRDRDNIAIMLNVGYYNTNIYVFVSDALVYIATLYVGGMHIIKDLSTVLSIDLNYAEQLMRQFVFGIEYEPDAKDYIRLQNGRLTAFDHSMVEQIITARMSETTDYIREAIHSSGFDYTDKTKLFILGDGFSGMKGNREYLSAKLGFEIESLPLDLTDGTTKFDVSALSLFDYVARQQSTRQPRRFLISPFKQESGGQQYAGI